MRLRTYFFLIVISYCGLSPSFAYAERLIVYAEDALPYGYMENDKVSSPVADFVRILVVRAGYDPDIRLLSWAGIMHTAEADQTVIFFPLARTSDREDKYVWLGTLFHDNKYNLYKLKKRDDIQLKKLDDAKKYRIGTIEADVREEFLLENGFRYHATMGLTRIVNNKDGMRLLQVGRIDLLPMSVENFTAICSPNCTDYENSYHLNLNLDLEIAANKATPMTTILRLRQAYEILEKNGTRSRMIAEN